MKARILGMGVLAPAAANVPELVQALERPPPGLLRLTAIPEPMDPKQRRLPRIERMALAVAREALGTATPPAGLALVFGTGMGAMSATVDYLEGVATRGLSFGSPTAFHQSVHHSPAGQLSLALGLRGIALTVSSRELSGESALRVGLDLLESGRAEQVLVVSADEWAPALEAACEAFGVLGPASEPPRHDALTLGEGAAALLLGAGDPGLVLERCQLTAHPTAVLHFARAEHFEALLQAELPPSPSTGFFSLAAPSRKIREEELQAVRRRAPQLTPIDDLARTGFHASAGLVRLVLAATRLTAMTAPCDAYVHGLSLGGGQALTRLRHEPR